MIPLALVFRFRGARRSPASVPLMLPPGLRLRHGLHPRLRFRRLGIARHGPSVDADLAAHRVELPVRPRSGWPLRPPATMNFPNRAPMTSEEIAAVVGCPVGTVRSRLHRARRMLQRELWEMASEMGIAPRGDRPTEKPKSSLKSLFFFFLP